MLIQALTCIALSPAKATESYVPDLPSVVVYEANLRALGPKVGFESLRNRLGKIKALGVNVLWLMPIQPVGKLRSAGGLGSPYAVADYDKVNPEFGNADDLHRLIATAHRLKIAVLIDWVAGHTAWDNPWIKDHPDWYLRTPKGEISTPPGTGWNDVAALDFGNASMQSAMIASMKGWISRFGIDGFRCDAADRMPPAFWKSAITSLRRATSKKLLLLAEGFRSADYSSGFDLTYGWDFCSKLREVFAGKPATEIAASDAYEQKELPNGARRLRFITNHDISAWEGSLLDLYKTPQGAKTAFTLAVLYGGSPLIYSGQEVAWNKRIPMFDHSSIDWSMNLETGRWMAQLLTLRKRHPALLTGRGFDFSTNDAVSFTRTEGTDQAVVLANVRNRPTVAAIPKTLQGGWRDRDGKSVKVGSELTLSPYDCTVLVRTIQR